MFRWYTSDTHFNHANLLKYEPGRQAWGAGIVAHDQAITDAWRARVAPGDAVLHLGDVAFGPREHLQGLRALLPGTVTVVLGNHDRGPKAMQECGFKAVRRLQFHDPDLGEVVCRHDPVDFLLDEIRGADVLLHGHLHSTPLADAVKDRMMAATDARLLLAKAVCLSLDVLPSAPAPLAHATLVALIRSRDPSAH